MLTPTGRETAMPVFRGAVLFLALTSLPALTSGYEFYQPRIPNGDKVPHPCIPNYLWKGVGHISHKGAGNRNHFGEDFDKLGRNWTRALCEKDSDGDGRTNGQELGDPTCQWSEGKTPSVTTGITHPGVCDPWGSPSCGDKNKWVSCEKGEFNCSATKAPDVFNMTLRFPHTKVPAEETTYICQTFNLRDDKDYHLVATQPLLNNTRVMHHMLLFGCVQEQTLSDTPKSCFMTTRGCDNIIGSWTVGSAGECLPDNVGFLVGQSGYKSVVLQFHWNNPERSDDYYDSSAMVVHLTASTREQNAGVLMVGQDHLEIPPGVAEHTEMATLPPSCSNMVVQKDFNVVLGMNHMHYLGRRMRVELCRDKKKVTDLAHDEAYNYDKPVQHRRKTPVLVKKGDEIKTTCVFSSSSRTNTTFRGEATNAEMCYGFFVYYPEDALQQKFLPNWKSIDFCQRSQSSTIGECNQTRFFNREYWPTLNQVLANCNEWGSCRTECRAVVRNFRQHPCFQGDAGDYMLWLVSQDPSGKEFIQRAQTCPEEFLGLSFTPTPLTCPPAVGPGGSAGIPKGGVLGPLLVLLVVIAVLV